MVWYCRKHEQHSIDDACWRCDQEHDQPYIDAWLAGWQARHSVPHGDHSQEQMEKDLAKWKNENSHLLHTRLRGTHDT